MTSVEFVIWMRGFMAYHPSGFSMDGPRADAIRKTLELVDGVPMPREGPTDLVPPAPITGMAVEPDDAEVDEERIERLERAMRVLCEGGHFYEGARFENALAVLNEPTSGAPSKG